jgi:serine phosphatase RsbU (regulator of sigma subunit)
VNGALDRPPETPLGLPTRLADISRKVHEATLEPGDRMLLYTDGVVDAPGPDGEPFGLARFTDFIIRTTAAGQPAPEALRLLVHAILEHQQSHRRRSHESSARGARARAVGFRQWR